MTCGFVSRQFPAEVSFDEAKTYAVLTGCGLEVGSYVVVEGGGRRYLASVSKLQVADIYAVAKTPVLTPEQEKAVSLRLGPLIAELEILSECSGNSCGPPATPVPIHSSVRPPAPGEVGEMLGLPREGVVLGALALPSGRAVEGEVVRLPLEALRHHVLVVGTTGSGKTVLVKEIAKQLAGQQVVALDAVGHFYHLAYSGVRVRVVLPVTRQMARRGARAVVRRVVKTAAWGSRARFKARVRFRKQRATGEGYLAGAVVEVESPRGRGVFEVVPWALESSRILRDLPRAIPILSQQARIFYQRVLKRAVELSGQKTAEGLYEFLTSPAEGERRPVVMYEKLGMELGLHSSTMENIVRALLALVETGLVDVVGGGFRVVEPRYDFSGYTVVDISRLNVHQQRLVVYRILDAVYRRARPTTAVLIDEAHLFFPQTRSEDEQAFIEGHLTRLTRLGRARGIAVVFATHMPNDLNDVVVQLANTKVILRSDLKILERLDVPAKDRRFLAVADKGIAYVRSYAYRHPIYVKVQKTVAHFG